MFNRVLIANRGEIALRVIRTCKEMGIETVAVYSKVDENASYLDFADEAICIGPGPSAQSYLDISRIIAAVEITDVEAVHPGYGFLSENPSFAEICESCNVHFIGPSAEAIELLGNKARARTLAKEAGVPLIPGSKGIVESSDEALALAHEIGYPVIIKAASGGGGRGMRIAHTDISLVNGMGAARAEAEVAFKDSRVYIEKYILKPRHIEVQILADNHGNIIHLGERDCSLQRRHQKLVEEAPSPFLPEETRNQMGEAAIRLAKAAGYTNAGTVEFLMDEDGKFYFIEMNARIQVEHPVTEMVTGIDLVREQIRIASGLPLTFSSQDQVHIRGHAIEARINAEDPSDGFKPCPGIIGQYIPAGGLGVRLDSHVFSGYRIPSQYDSMIAKLIVHRGTRQEAIEGMRRALSEFKIGGIKTTLPLHMDIFRTKRFVKGEYDTHFIEEFTEE